MKYVSLLFLIVWVSSCYKEKEGKKRVVEKNEVQPRKITSDSGAVSQNISPRTTVKKDTLNEVMLAEDIRFNGKLERFFRLSEFEKVFGKTDSTRLMSEEAPCSYIFENPDGSKEMNDQYLYKNGSRFENSGQEVAVDEFKFQNGDYILYKGIRIDAKSSLKDIQRLFPNAVRNRGVMDVYNEGKLQVIQLREDEKGISDGHINIFFRNNRIYSLHWWFPC